MKKFLLITLCCLLTGCVNNFDLRNVSTMKALGKLMTPRFIAHGANTVDVSNVIAKLDERVSTDNWTIQWSKLANQYEIKGQKCLDDNNLDDARYLLLKASVYYRIAGYPYPIDGARTKAYQKSVELYKQYCKFLDNPPQLITIPFETKKIVGYFRKPKADQKTALVILLPGLDSTKEEMIWLEDLILERGYAVFSMDIPGTGESQWEMRADTDRVLARVTRYFQEDSSIKGDRIAAVGFNFGGYWAIKLACQKNLLAGAVAVCPPIHYTFDSNRLSQMPRFLLDIFKKACGVNDYTSLQNIFNGFSLKNQKFLSKLNTPLLIISAGKDILIAPEDITITSQESSIPVSLKIYPEEQMGIINNLTSDLYPLILDWLDNILS